MPNPSNTLGGRYKDHLKIPSPLADNRAFRYGDGLFETILVRNGQPWNKERHLNRLLNGMEILGFDFDKVAWRANFDDVLNSICDDLPSRGFGRIRLQVYRSGAGTYLPDSDRPEYVVEAHPLESDPWKSGKEIKVGIYHEIPLNHSILSAVKSINALPYIMGARYARSKGWDDAILRSVSGFIAESTRSNIFIARGASLSTPSLKSGCLPGVMRASVIEVANKAGLEVMERPVSLRDLTDSDEIFLTNVVRGLVPVISVEGQEWKPSGDGTRKRMMEGILQMAS